MKPAKIKTRNWIKGRKKTNKWRKRGKPSRVANPR
jgi:hypothetical protein